jgi:hypothetical protein
MNLARHQENKIEALMRRLTKPSLCVLLFVAGGCIVPAPDRVTNGHRYSREALAFLDAPTTTRDDVLSTLGDPIIESRNTRVLVYEWEQMVRAFTPVKEIHGDPERVCLFIAYDGRGVVCGHAVRKIGIEDLEMACVEWKNGRRKW